MSVDARGWVTLGAGGAALLVALVVAGYVAVGLFQARSLVRREFSAYFLSLVAYVVLIAFLGMTGWLFADTLGLLTTTGPEGTEWPMRTMFADPRFWGMFLVIPPLLTMRLFAEERSSGTLEVLLTAPLRDWQVVLSKYVACLAFYCVLWVPTLFYLPALLGAARPAFHAAWTVYSITFLAGLGLALAGFLSLLPRLDTGGRLVSLVLLFGGLGLAIEGGWFHYHRDALHVLEIPVQLDPYPVLATYLGMFLAGAMFLAVGLLVSSLVRDQMVAALISMTLGLLFVLAVFWRPEQDGGAFYQFVYFFSVPLHFERAFTRGVIDTRPLVLYASTALFCLFLTVRSVEASRWR